MNKLLEFKKPFTFFQKFQNKNEKFFVNNFAFKTHMNQENPKKFNYKEESVKINKIIY